jgi:hypothetical protein
MKDANMQAFDEQTLLAHSLLDGNDDCYYFVEYTARKPYNHSEANGFITNLKKKPSVRGTYQWQHKLSAMTEAANALSRALPASWLRRSTFVPVPPSKDREHPEYDDRMSTILRELKNADVREIVYQLESMDATHVSPTRHTVSELAANYRIDEGETDPEPTHIVVVDDMVTAGAHYKAMHRVLEARFPRVPISGVFLARRIFPEDE